MGQYIGGLEGRHQAVTSACVAPSALSGLTLLDPRANARGY
jgi:hypothetical protein